MTEHQTERAIGSWLSAALDDDKVCAEMKADILAWMEWVERRGGAEAQQAAPKVTEFNVGRWCLSEDECIADGIDFRSYELGIFDAANAFGKNRSAPAHATPLPAQVQPAAHEQLRKFYSVSADAELIEAQARHIEKLQAKLSPTPSLAPQRVREG